MEDDLQVWKTPPPSSILFFVVYILQTALQNVRILHQVSLRYLTISKYKVLGLDILEDLSQKLEALTFTFKLCKRFTEF